MDTQRVDVAVTVQELNLLLESLDTYEYWELGDRLPRNNGAVFIPGDYLGEGDPYWADGEPSEAQQETIDLVLECRALAGRLHKRRREALELMD